MIARDWGWGAGVGGEVGERKEWGNIGHRVESFGYIG